MPLSKHLVVAAKTAAKCNSTLVLSELFVSHNKELFCFISNKTLHLDDCHILASLTWHHYEKVGFSIYSGGTLHEAEMSLHATQARLSQDI